MMVSRAGFVEPHEPPRRTAVPRSAMLPGCLPGSTRWKRAELGLSILLTGELQYGEETEHAQSNAKWCRAPSPRLFAGTGDLLKCLFIDAFVSSGIPNLDAVE